MRLKFHEVQPETKTHGPEPAWLHPFNRPQMGSAPCEFGPTSEAEAPPAPEALPVHRRILDAAPTGIFQITPAGRLLDANRAFVEMLGYSTADSLLKAAESNGPDVWTLPEERARLLGDMAANDRLIGRECRLRCRDGSLVWTLLNLRKVGASHGLPCCLVGTVEDVTVRRQAEKVLRDSEERYRASFEQAALGILHTSLDGHILKCNGRFLEIVGYAPEELIGKSFQAITPAEDRGSGKAAAEQLLSADTTSVSFEKRYLRKDGTLTWVLLTISVQRDGEGRPLHFLTLVQDNNAYQQSQERLKAALEALRTSEERYRTAFQMTLDSINISRLRDGVHVECNRAFLEVTGYSREEVVGKNSLELGLWADPADRTTMLQTLQRHRSCRDLEAQFRKKNGELFCGLLSATLLELDGDVCVLSLTRDVSQAKAAEAQIRNLAFYDSLTGLPNRRMLLERLPLSHALQNRTMHKRALLFVDLDDFKTLNDTLGHHMGDLLLQDVAGRLTRCVRPGDTAARLGGDEFVVILENLSSVPEQAAAEAQIVADRILGAIAQPYRLGDRESVTSASIGITLFDAGRSSTSDLLQQADIAMYQAKAAGRNTMRFFAPALQSAVNARALLEDELRQGARNHEFQLFYQPQIAHGRVIGAEALLRWNHPRRGILPPSEFISLAEETGLIIPLGTEALESACRQLAAWSAQKDFPSITVAVNVSARQFRQPDFVQTVLSALERTQADPHSLKLEITESMLLDSIEETIAVMTELKAHGIQFSLDDFGTGYSSLAYLKRLPLDQLKIDRVFVRDMLKDPTCTAIARTIISLSGLMGLSLVAEGVETEEQQAQLDAFGCYAYQGYLFSPPIPVAAFEALITARQS